MSSSDLHATASESAHSPHHVSDGLERYRAALTPVFGTPQRVLVRGEGRYVWDDQGRKYLDLLAGIAVNALGHGHHALTSALAKQAQQAIHISNLFASYPQIELAESLLNLADAPQGSAVFFANSGAEANEAAVKIARLTGKPRIICLEHAFHGRTMGALALTWKDAYRAPFEPLPGGVEWIPAGDIQALEDALSPGDVAAVIAEPIQGEAGVLPLSHEYLRALREKTREHGALLVFDEVQTGMARTGHWFAHQAVEGLQPDVMTLAKGLGGGVPIGAAVTYGPQVTGLLQPGLHGTTFGGNPLAATAGLAVIAAVREENLLQAATERGEQLVHDVEALEDPRIVGVRGAGLLRGIVLAEPLAQAAVTVALDAGFILNAPDASVLRLAPPLTITADELSSFIQALPSILDVAAAQASA